MNVLVHHEGVGANIVRLHEPVGNAVYPGKMAVQPYGAWHGGCKVQQKMGEHHHVCFDADEFASQIDVWLEETGVKETGKFERFEIPGDEHGWFKFFVFGVVDGF